MTNASVEQARSWITQFCQAIHTEVGGVAILNGSLRTGEWVAGYSDIDLEWVLPDAGIRKVVDTIRRITGHAVTDTSYVLNLRPMRQSEFPGAYRDGIWDYVRRRPLQQGWVLAGRADLLDEIELAATITDHERRTTLSNLDAFLRLLRRMYVNPLAISSVNSVHPRLLLVKATAATIHGCRWAAAALTGHVLCNLTACTTHTTQQLTWSPTFTRHITNASTVRSDWAHAVTDTTMDAAVAYLGDTLSAIEEIRDAVASQIGAPSIPAIYSM